MFRIKRLVAHRRVGDAVLIAADQQLQEAHQRGPEARRHPAEQNGKEEQNAGLQHIRQDLHHRLLPVLIQHLHRIEQRPALIGQDGFHVPGGDDGLKQGKDQQHIAANGADVTPLLLGALLFRIGVAMRQLFAAQRAPGTHQRVGPPGFREHQRAFNLRHRLQRGAIEIIFAELLAVGQRIRPRHFDAGRDRLKRRIVRTIAGGDILAKRIVNEVKRLGVLQRGA